MHPGIGLMFALLVCGGFVPQAYAEQAVPHVEAAPALLPPALVARAQADFELGADGSVNGYEAVTPLPADMAAKIEQFVRSLSFKMTDERGLPRPSAGRIQLTLARDVAAGGRLGPVRVENVLFLAVESLPDTRSIRNVTAKVTRRKPLKYPESALQHGVSGRVLAEFTFDVDGRVRDVAVRQSALLGVAGDPELLARLAGAFETATLESLRQWKLRVAVVDRANVDPKELKGLANINFQLLERRSWSSFEWIFEARTRLRAPQEEMDTSCCDVGVSDMGPDAGYDTFTNRFELATDPRGRLL